MATGTGTQNDPYLVSTMAEVYQYCAIEGAYVELTNDIDVSEDTAYREGTTSELVIKGHFSSQGDNTYSISGLVITSLYYIQFYDGSSMDHIAIINGIQKCNADLSRVLYSEYTTPTISYCNFSVNQYAFGYSNYGAITGANYSYCGFYININSYGTATPNTKIFGPTSMTRCCIYYNGVVNAPSNSTSGLYGLLCDATYTSIIGEAEFMIVGSGANGWVRCLNECNNCYCAVSFQAPTRYSSYGYLTVNSFGLAGINFVVPELTESTEISFTTSSTLLRLTSAQAKDEEYLYSIGFLP